MKALLVDRLGFERIVNDAAGNAYIVPRRLAEGQSEFRIYGRIERDGEELIEFREVDDMAEELKRTHGTVNYLRSEIRRLEGTIRGLENENGSLALEARRASQQRSDGGPK